MAKKTSFDQCRALSIKAEHRASGTRTTVPRPSIKPITFPCWVGWLHVLTRTRVINLCNKTLMFTSSAALNIFPFFMFFLKKIYTIWIFSMYVILLPNLCSLLYWLLCLTTDYQVSTHCTGIIPLREDLERILWKDIT